MTEKNRFPTTGWGGAETFLAVCWRCCCAGSRPRMHWDEMCGQQVAQGHCKLFCNCEIGPSVKGPEKLGVGVGGGLESSLERCGGPWGRGGGVFVTLLS